MSPRILPPDVYDALELSALAFDGIGSVFTWDVDGHTPRCLIGHIETLAGTQWRSEHSVQVGELRVALLAAFDAKTMLGVAFKGNDSAFTRDEQYAGTRLPWAEYCRRLNIVRGETPSAGDAVST